MKENITIDDKDKSNIWKVIFTLMGSVALLAIVAGVVIMLLQAFNEIEYPHGVIAGSVCLAFGLLFLIVERGYDLINLKMNKKESVK